MELTDLALQYGSLAGLAAVITVLVNIGKSAGVVKDGQAPTYSLVLNLIGFAVMSLLGVFNPEFDEQGVNVVAQQVADIALSILGLITQLKVSPATHEAVKGVPLVGKSFAKKNGQE